MYKFKHDFQNTWVTYITCDMYMCESVYCVSSYSQSDKLFVVT
jgi:hypothetical protein